MLEEPAVQPYDMNYAWYTEIVTNFKSKAEPISFNLSFNQKNPGCLQFPEAYQMGNWRAAKISEDFVLKRVPDGNSLKIRRTSQWWMMSTCPTTPANHPAQSREKIQVRLQSSATSIFGKKKLFINIISAKKHSQDRQTSKDTEIHIKGRPHQCDKCKENFKVYCNLR